MTGQEIVDNINLELDKVGASGAFSDSELLGFANEGYTDFCRDTESLEKSATSAVSALHSAVSLPTDFLDSRQFRWSYNRQLHARTVREKDEDKRGWVFSVGVPEDLIFYNYNKIRLEPKTSSAGTVTHRYAYVPSDFTLTTEPSLQAVWHHALVDYGSAIAFITLREFEDFDRCWQMYLDRRRDAKAEARVYQRTPNTLLSQKPVTSFNYRYWKAGR